VTELGRAIAFQRRPLSTLIELQRSAGDCFPLRTLVAGRVWVVAAPQLADEVLRGPPGLYLAGSANRRILPVLPHDTEPRPLLDAVIKRGAAATARRSSHGPWSGWRSDRRSESRWLAAGSHR
jgi:hypothetical protein